MKAKSKREKKRRSIAKTITFRVSATVVTVLIVLLFTGNLTASIGVGILDFVSKLLLYYWHERIWDGVHWGLN